MKYVLSHYDCQCGQRIVFRINVELVDRARVQPFIEICPFCDGQNKITPGGKNPVLCRKSTNKPAVFDSKDEETYRNATFY